MGNDFKFDVDVHIHPLWLKPAETDEVAMLRAQVDARLGVLAREIAQRLMAALEENYWAGKRTDAGSLMIDASLKAAEKD